MPVDRVTGISSHHMTAPGQTTLTGIVEVAITIQVDADRRVLGRNRHDEILVDTLTRDPHRRQEVLLTLLDVDLAGLGGLNTVELGVLVGGRQPRNPVLVVSGELILPGSEVHLLRLENSVTVEVDIDCCVLH